MLTSSSDGARERAESPSSAERGKSAVGVIWSNVDGVRLTPTAPDLSPVAGAPSPAPKTTLSKRRRSMRGFAIPCSLPQLRWWFAVQGIYARSVGSTFAKPANDNAVRGAR